MTPQDFDAMVVRSKHPILRALYIGQIDAAQSAAAGVPVGSMLPPDVRSGRARDAALQGGLIVDPDSDAGGMSPWFEMTHGIEQGLLTKPKIGEKIPNGGLLLMPGVESPNIPHWNDFTFAIKYTLDPKDYPPYPDPPSVDTKFVGGYCGNMLYAVINGGEKIFVAGQDRYEVGPFGGPAQHYVFTPTVIPDEFFWTRIPL